VVKLSYIDPPVSVSATHHIDFPKRSVRWNVLQYGRCCPTPNIEIMNDETFLAFVINNAPSCCVETLRSAVDKLIAHIASRVFGRPNGIEIGSHVEATAFGGSFRRCGTVITLTDRGCVIEPPSSRYMDRISFKKHIVCILDEFEWNRVCFVDDLFRKRARTNKRPVNLLSSNKCDSRLSKTEARLNGCSWNR